MASMHTSRQNHLDHRRLRRIVTQKLEAREATLEARSPQFGFGGFGGNGHSGGNHGGNDGGGVGGGNHGNNNNNGNNGKPATTTSNVDVPTPTPSPQPPSTPNAVTQPLVPNGSIGSGTGVNPGSSGNGNTGNNGSVGSTIGGNAPASSSSSTVSQPRSLPTASSVLETDIVTPSSSPGLAIPVENGSPNPTYSATSSLPTESTVASPLSAASGSGIAGSAIAAIVIVSFLALLLLVLLLIRRRWISRRHDRMQRWWFTRKRDSQKYDEKTEYLEEKALPIPPSPTIERDSPSPLDLSRITPTSPPTAEVRIHHGGSTSNYFGHPNQLNYNRSSIGSTNSDESNTSKFIVVHHPETNRAESFKFPKPPFQTASEATSIHSRDNSGTSGTSGTSFRAVCSTPTKPFSSSLSRPPLTPPLAALTRGEDAQPIPIPNPFFTSPDQSFSIPNPFSRNPFDDDHALSTVGNFSAVETVRRPYTPSLDDELLVETGEKVNVLEIFEDGWAMVQKIEEDDSTSEGPDHVSPRGLIPIACLREATQDLSSFLHTKRVQSFYVFKQTTN